MTYIFFLAKTFKKIFCDENFQIFFFWQKQNNIHLFKLIKTSFNIFKNLKDKFTNKFTTFKFFFEEIHNIQVNNNKIIINNMIKLESPEYRCLQICNVNVQIINWITDFQYELNENRNNTRNQSTLHKTTDITLPHSDNEIMKKKKPRCKSFI